MRKDAVRDVEEVRLRFTLFIILTARLLHCTIHVECVGYQTAAYGSDFFAEAYFYLTGTPRCQSQMRRMIRHAFDNAVNSPPLRKKLQDLKAKKDNPKIVFAFDDVSLPLPPMQEPDIRCVRHDCIPPAHVVSMYVQAFSHDFHSIFYSPACFSLLLWYSIP